MANRPPAPAASEQPTLFHGSLNYDFELRFALTTAINSSGLTRGEIARRMSDYAGSSVSKTTVDAWTAPSRDKWNIPVRLAVAFDVATNGTRILDLLAAKHGRTVLSPKEALDAELGSLARQEADIQQRRTDLLAAIETTRGRR
jgi:hypothetical protein